ncbi:MAG: aminopeptidase [Proteobacteria bacterium]|nr:aminopeptidase [Pseudomonadota bacterium]NOG61715.1 aminopeptidase [Pseudomonadota bacterium]
MRRQNQHYFILLLIIFFLSGCTSVQYYSQSIQGQFEVLKKRQDINDILDDPNVSSSLRDKLNTVLQLRQFSTEQLGLPKNNSYLSYADLERDYVIWNIFANEEFSLEPLSWCYLIIGCLSYRGYFSQSEAEKNATHLKQQGYDIYLGGVAAYSTLGWFDDPVLNTMLRWSENYLATVMFHELAHQQLYIKNDTEFNESYADAVAHIGVTRWLRQKHDKGLLDEYNQSQIHEKIFVALVMRYKSILNKLYHSSEDKKTKRSRKKNLFQKMQTEYFEMTKSWGENPYKKWFSSDINNAKLASVVTYRKHVPAFLEIYEKLNKNLAQFYSFSKSLSSCNPMKRKEILKTRKIEFEC